MAKKKPPTQDKFLVTLKDEVIIAQDEEWSEIFREGTQIPIRGGTILKVSEEDCEYGMAVKICSRLYPDMRCIITVKQASEMEQVSGKEEDVVNASPEIPRCHHHNRDAAQNIYVCQSCFTRFWLAQSHKKKVGKNTGVKIKKGARAWVK